jgi:manganese transport protein
MGDYVNSRLTDVAAIAATIAILALNVILLLQTFGVDVPFLLSA